MGMKIKIFALLLIISALFGLPIYAMQRMDIEYLLLCSAGQGGFKIPASVCNVYFRSLRTTAADIENLSRGPGLSYVLAIDSGDKRFKDADILIANGLPVDGVNHNTNDGLTPLHAAILAKDVKAVKYLLANGANSNLRERKNNQTSREFAEHLYQTEQSPEITQIIGMLQKN